MLMHTWDINMNRVLKYVLTFIIMILAFCILLTITSLIPKSAIEENVRESAKILNKQENSFLITIKHYKTIKIDNYTDALMINTAYSIDNAEPFYSSMVARKDYIKGITKEIHPDEKGELKSPKTYTMSLTSTVSFQFLISSLSISSISLYGLFSY